jgi:hypothetical protein
MIVKIALVKRIKIKLLTIAVLTFLFIRSYLLSHISNIFSSSLLSSWASAVNSPFSFPEIKDNQSQLQLLGNVLFDQGSRPEYGTISELLKQQEIDRLYIKPKQYILDKIDEIYEKEFKGHVVLGVIARGSEYNYWHGNIYGVFRVEDYVREIKKILEAKPEITKLLIVSDETDYVNALHEAFPDSYFMPDIFRRTDETIEYMNRVPCWMNVSTKRENH